MSLKEKLHDIVLKYQKKTPHLQVHLQSSLLEHSYAYGTQGSEQPFHSASVGKMMTAVLVIALIEQSKLDWDTPVNTLLDATSLNHLFVVKGVDYQNEVTIHHLLSHTSGVNDYFDGKTKGHPRFLKEVLKNQDRFYHPTELIQFTQYHQQAIGKPGSQFLYSDTGYLLLGLICEAVYQKPFYQILKDELFIPLEMKDTGLLFYDPSCQVERLAPVMVYHQDLRLKPVLSIDFSGGGLSTTLTDLARFLNALQQGNVVSQESLAKMRVFQNRFIPGIQYGLGLMEVQFEKLFFLLKGFPRLYGHLGVLGVHAWIDPESNDAFVINVSDMGKMGLSFRLLIELVSLLKKERQKK